MLGSCNRNIVAGFGAIYQNVTSLLQVETFKLVGYPKGNLFWKNLATFLCINLSLEKKSLLAFIS